MVMQTSLKEENLLMILCDSAEELSLGTAALDQVFLDLRFMLYL
jgi:hypothetical protein